MKVNNIRKTELEMTTQEKETIVNFLDVVFKFYNKQRDWMSTEFVDMLDAMYMQEFDENINYGDENEKFNIKIIDK
jgi:hypothetical protein